MLARFFISLLLLISVVPGSAEAQRSYTAQEIANGGGVGSGGLEPVQFVTQVGGGEL